MQQFYTAESVARGHPDKLCDQIADAILDDCLACDPAAHVACEVLATKGHIIVAGELTSSHAPEVGSIVRSVLKDVGYTNCLGYRKGADGKPEIVPEEARVIRLIAQDFLNGESLHTIKLTLEGLGVRSPSGNITWSTQTIQRILQNEKYVGDVLLQKTYTADFLEGKVKKNNGELPQYYIRDNHPAILTREEFTQIQEELARRRSKRPANAKSKTNKGRFTSKYALSERLVCGCCGSPYRRVTWNIHGRKEIVWRCISRLENGKAGCPNSPSIPEEELHQAILEAVRSLVERHQEEMALTLESSLVRPASPEEEYDNKLAQLEGEFDRLLAQAGEDGALDSQLQQVSTEILFLKKRREQAEKTVQRSQAQQSQKGRTAAPPGGAGAEPHPIRGHFDVPHCGAGDGGITGRSADTVCGWGGETSVSKKIPVIECVDLLILCYNEKNTREGYYDRL